MKAERLAATWAPKDTQNAIPTESTAIAAHQSVKGYLAYLLWFHAHLAEVCKRQEPWLCKSKKVSYKLGIPQHLVKVHL